MVEAEMSTTRRKRNLSIYLSPSVSLASRLTVEQILTERDIAPNACLFISMPVTDGSSAGGSFTRGGATRGDTRRHTQCTHAAIYIDSDMYIQLRVSSRMPNDNHRSRVRIVISFLSSTIEIRSSWRTNFEADSIINNSIIIVQVI